MPDAVKSVVLGDPDCFVAEHSEREPQLVFVKPITAKPAQTNLLISTARGYQASLLLISHGEKAGAQPDVDFMMRYRPAGGFIIEPSTPSVSIAQTVALPISAQVAKRSGMPPTAQPRIDVLAGADRPHTEPALYNPGWSEAVAAAGMAVDARTIPPSADSGSGLDALLARQRQAPLPALYGERPGIAPPGKQMLKTGVSEVIDEGKEVVVLFSVVNMQAHAVELMPPQVQLGGQMKKGTIRHHSVWSSSEQLPVEDFRMSRRRIGAGERADGVLVFQRPSFKQSNETLLLQMADSGAVDRPALAPIGFGISSLREGQR
jgi:hypothetical protein